MLAVLTTQLFTCTSTSQQVHEREKFSTLTEKLNVTSTNQQWKILISRLG
jgi:hypothetical protein